MVGQRPPTDGLRETIRTTTDCVPLPPRWSRVAGLQTALVTLALAGTAHAQQVGAEVCGTPLATAVDSGSTLAVGLLMVLGATLTYLLNNYAGLKRDPEEVRFIKDWRNRAVFSVVTTPFVAWGIVWILEQSGIELAACIDVVPFF